MNSFNFIVLSFFVLGIHGDCPDGYFHAGDSCYSYSVDTMSQAAAQEVSIALVLKLNIGICLDPQTFKNPYAAVQYIHDID